MKISIYRYNPDQDQTPYMQDYDFPLPDQRDMMVLDILERLKERDSTLSYRRSCREGVCGSDGMNINGANGLACTTRLSQAMSNDTLVLRPLPGLPVIRDLVVDMTLFWESYKKATPWLINEQPALGRERLQSPEDRAKLDGLYECIMCACCSSACPSYWWNPDKYLGPAALLTAYRFIIDSRDTATDERLAGLDDPYSVYRCKGILNCVTYCPKGLNPRRAIGRIEALLLRNGS